MVGRECTTVIERPLRWEGLALEVLDVLVLVVPVVSPAACA